VWRAALSEGGPVEYAAQGAFVPIVELSTCQEGEQMDAAGEISWVKKDGRYESAAPVGVSFLGQQLPVVVEPEGDSLSVPQEEALTQFLALPPGARSELTHPLALDCRYAELAYLYLSGGREPLVTLGRRADVWDYVQFTGVFVPRHGGSRDRYVYLLAVEHWDEQPLLALLFKNGEFFALERQGNPFPGPAWDAAYVNE